jgi:Group XII secretory phospholipase A2 precursor (PLA2G12)
MHFQGFFLVVVCLLASTAHAQPPPQPIVAPTPPAPGAGVLPPGPCPYDPQITAEDCPNKSCWGAPPNGCGSRSLIIINEKIVPDQWPAGVNFNEACNAHDTCYFTPGILKDDCDNKFHEALLVECRRALACTDLPIVGNQCFQNPTDNPLFKPCQELADLYFNAVQQVGQDPFNRDQEEAKQYAAQCHQAAAQRAG